MKCPPPAESESESAKIMWDEEYNRDLYVYGTEPNNFLKAKFSSIPKGKVLCLAEGEGRNAVFLATQGYTVTAVDISPVAREKALKLAQENNVNIEFVCTNLQDYKLGEQKWDGIVSISCHLPPDIRKPLFSKVMRALKTEGVFFLEGYTPDQLAHGTGGPPMAEMMTTKETLTSELPGMHFEHLEELERILVEGINHTGVGSVVQAIGSPNPLQPLRKKQ